MIRITAYEYVLQERTMREQKRKKQKADHGFQQMLEAEIQKLKGAQNGKDKNQHQYQDR